MPPWKSSNAMWLALSDLRPIGKPPDPPRNVSRPVRPQRRSWGGSGFDAAGLDCLMGKRRQYYVRRQRDRTFEKGDRAPVLGRGIAGGEHADETEVHALLWLRLTILPCTCTEKGSIRNARALLQNFAYIRRSCICNGSRCRARGSATSSLNSGHTYSADLSRPSRYCCIGITFRAAGYADLGTLYTSAPF